MIHKSIDIEVIKPKNRLKRAVKGVIFFISVNLK